ncbi:hypothetical protein KC19_VG135000 [Ceratodon purpureus]|uniref:Uncharacterized protein n=1 Tax=Ceratodon purpureus TaxID=3225 RepID=A0A8T0HQ70_CERPU|nr:hypothetical protein KC19_VG135000 [Ceratodon purpureus]
MCTNPSQTSRLMCRSDILNAFLQLETKLRHKISGLASGRHPVHPQLVYFASAAVPLINRVLSRAPKSSV